MTPDLIREVVADLRLLLPESCRVSRHGGWIRISTGERVFTMRPSAADELIRRLPTVPSALSVAMLSASKPRPYRHPKHRIILALAKLRRSARILEAR